MFLTYPGFLHVIIKGFENRKRSQMEMKSKVPTNRSYYQSRKVENLSKNRKDHSIRHEQEHSVVSEPLLLAIHHVAGLQRHIILE